MGKKENYFDYFEQVSSLWDKITHLLSQLLVKRDGLQGKKTQQLTLPTAT